MTTENNAATPAGMETNRPVAARARSPGLELLNVYELQVIENLFTWVSAEQEVAPEAVRSLTEASFATHDVAAIHREDYEKVIQFLVDLRLDEIANWANPMKEAKMTPAQLRAARALLDWSRNDLSRASGVSVETLKNLETGKYKPQDTTVKKLLGAFSGCGVEFIGCRQAQGVMFTPASLRNGDGEAHHESGWHHIFCIALGFTAVVIQGGKPPTQEGVAGGYKFTGLIEEYLPNYRARGFERKEEEDMQVVDLISTEPDGNMDQLRAWRRRL
jgi:DNA-binding XRE family transcriptional regulator